MKKKTKIICIIISVIAIICGFIGSMSFAELWTYYKQEAYTIAALISFIVFIGGIISTIIIAKQNEITGNRKPKQKRSEYQYQNSNTKYKEDPGEHIVRLILGETRAGEQYIINNLIIANQDKTKSSQIDHVFINKYGIWCIETKNWNGMIFGRESDKKWTQVFNYGKEKYTYYNPVKQNATHVYYLKKVLRYKNQIHNIVVFTNGDISNIKSNNIYTIEELYRILWNNTENELSDEEMEMYYNKLQSLKNTQISDEQHVINIGA